MWVVKLRYLRRRESGYDPIKCLDCIRAVLDELDRGEYQRLGVSAPTGSGKTAIFTSLIRYLPPLVHPATGEHATRVLIVVSSIQLATQTAEVVRRTYPELSVEVEQGSKKATGLAQVTVATYQTLARGDLSRLDKFDPDYYKAVIVDEAHHSAARSYLDIASRFDSHVADNWSYGDLTAADNSIPAASPIAPAPSSSAPSSSAPPSSASPPSTPTAPPSTPASQTSPKNLFELSPTNPENLVELDGDLTPEEATDHLPSSSLEDSTSIFCSPSESSTSDAELPEPVPRDAVLDEAGRHRVPLLAFSATWGRADGLALGTIWQRVVYHADWLDMVKASWLSPLRFTVVQLGSALDLSKVAITSSTGDFNMVSLANQVDKSEVNRIAVDSWLEKAEGRRSTLVFAVNIAHVISLTNEFRARGIDARFVYNETKPKDRQYLYRQFKEGEFSVLVNCSILTEGVDMPFVDCIMFVRPTRSQNLFLQMLGRGLRLSPDTGKQDCLLIDLVGNSTSSSGVICTPTLFGLNPEEKIDGASTDDLCARGLEEALSSTSDPSSEHGEEEPVVKLTDKSFAHRHSYHYRDYDTAFDLVRQEQKRGGEQFVPISRLSRLAWVGCGEEKWVLELLGGGYVKIVKDGDEYTSTLYRRIGDKNKKDQFYLPPKPLTSHGALPILIRTTDAIILRDHATAELSLARHAAWRRQDASDSQNKYVVKKLGKDIVTLDSPAMFGGAFEGLAVPGVWVGKPYKESVPVDSLTKGQASDIIARTVHGGLGYWKETLKGLVREEKKEAKEREKKEKDLQRLKGASLKLRSIAAE
ncbi:hypothetical protein JCM8547_002680 [Rhodosporidiobolus lusitaniae]